MVLSRDQVIGAIILVVSLLGIVAYGWLLCFYPLVVVQVTAFVAVAAVLALLAWIGWTLATTPPLESIEGAEGEEKEKEAEG